MKKNHVKRENFLPNLFIQKEVNIVIYPKINHYNMSLLLIGNYVNFSFG